MNVLQYIKELKEFTDPTRTAFNKYDSQFPGVCKFPYFRTHYNNALRANGVVPVKETTSTTSSLESIVDKDLSIGVLKIEKFNVNDENVLLEPIPTGTFFDTLVSKRNNGPLRKCVDVTVGAPGAGKTYSRVALAAAAKRLNPEIKAGFISCEMRKSEWLEEVVADPILAEVEVVFMLDYIGKSNYLSLLKEALSKFDIVVVDSFAVIIHHLMLVATKGTSEKKLIFDLINFFIECAETFNSNIQLINQVNKDGNYKGGTELPHMVSSLCFVKVENGQRYMYFEKNRNNGITIQRRLFFSKNKEKQGEIEFNQDAYKAAYEQIADKKQSIKDFLLAKASLNAEQSETEKSIEELGLGGENAEERAELEAHFNRENTPEISNNSPEIEESILNDIDFEELD